MSPTDSESIASALWRKHPRKQHDEDETQPLLIEIPTTSTPNLKQKEFIRNDVHLNIEEVQQIAQTNISKLLERGYIILTILGDNLKDITNKAGNL
jgi:hypothetical protein